MQSNLSAEIWRIAGSSAAPYHLPQRDKLIMISAIAMHANARLDDEYVVGIWRRDLENHLLRQSMNPATAHRGRDYIAPSWSGASLEV